MRSFIDDLKFGPEGLIPVVIQDYKSGDVLMVAYMNRESLEKSLETGQTCFFSRSRGRLWTKGETSGHFQIIKDILVDCDTDTLLIKVEQVGEMACHEGYRSCFFRHVASGGELENISSGEGAGIAGSGSEPEKNDSAPGYVGIGPEIIREVYEVILDRKGNPKEGSYTCYLFDKGQDKILKKVGEEAAEVIIASKNMSAEEITYEIADLYYHILVLLGFHGLTPEDIYRELAKRR